jgi:hypothetical protein
MASVGGFRNASPEEITAFREREAAASAGGYDHSDVEEAMQDPEVAAAMALLADKMGCLPGKWKGGAQTKEEKTEMMKDPQVKAAMAKIQEKMPMGGMDLGGKGTFKGKGMGKGKGGKGGMGEMMDMMGKGKGGMGKGKGDMMGKGKGMLGKGKGSGKGPSEEIGECGLCLGTLDGPVVPCANAQHRFCGNCVARMEVRGVGFVCLECRAPVEGAEKLWYECSLSHMQAERKKAEGDLFIGQAIELYGQEFGKIEKVLALEPEHTHAQFRLVSMYHNGEGVEKDLEKSVEWLVSAATEGHAQAQCNLAGMVMLIHSIHYTLIHSIHSCAHALIHHRLIDS